MLLNKLQKLACLVVAAVVFSSCASEKNVSEIKTVEKEKDMNIAQYHKITPKEAKEMREQAGAAIVVDVRTKEEFAQVRIEGAILIPDYEMEQSAEKMLPDKNAVILIYCRSGNRSRTAANILVAKGYTAVYDFGGLNTYPYETITD